MTGVAATVGGQAGVARQPDAFAIVPLMFVEYASIEADPAAGKCYFVLTNQVGIPVAVENVCSTC